MTAKKAARAVRLAEAMRFSPVARTNQEIMATDTMVVRMNCYEPGQVTPMHLHPDEDEVIYVVEGAGKFTFKDADDLPFQAGDLVCLPSDQFHQIEAGPEGRTVVIYFMTPDYHSVRPDDREEHPVIKELHESIGHTNGISALAPRARFPFYLLWNTPVIPAAGASMIEIGDAESSSNMASGLAEDSGDTLCRSALYYNTLPELWPSRAVVPA